EEEQLIFLGDYIDRGKDSLKVLNKVMELSKEYHVITLSGNHEQIFLNWLEKPNEMSEFYFNPKVGGAATIESFYTSPSINFDQETNIQEIVETIQKNFKKEIEFMKNLRFFY